MRHRSLPIAILLLAFSALQAAARAIETIVADINQPERDRADFTALIDHITNLTNAVKQPEVEVEDELVVAPPETPPAPAPEAEEEPVDAEYDAEIAAIFTEESAELLESADKALVEWVRDPSSQHHVGELKRHLHTLKGGARMAGIRAMGNLSHELETLIISLDDGRVKATPGVSALLQRSLDELHSMRDTVIAGKPVVPAVELEERIQQANAGFEIADDSEVEAVPAEAEEAAPGEFTVEPEDTISMVIVDTPLADELAEIGKEHEPEPEPEPEPVTRDCWTSRLSDSFVIDASISLRLARSFADSARARDSCWMFE